MFRGSKDTLARFVVGFGVAYIIFHILDPMFLKQAVASLSGMILTMAGQAPVVAGNFITTPSATVEVVSACTGLDSIAMLVGLLFADRRLTKHYKYALAAFGSFVLVGWNAARISLSVLSGNIEATHFMLWMVSIVIIIALWIGFLRLQTRTEKHKKAQKKKNKQR